MKAGDSPPAFLFLEGYMSRINSFYLSNEMWPSNVGDIAVLKGAEARHMLTVLRTEADQTIRLFDGHGHDGFFSVKEKNRNQALLEAIELNTHPEPSHGVTLAIGWGKSKRRNYLFEKTVELKGAGIAFWQACRSQGTVPGQPKETWEDKCIQAAKQCGNTHLPILNTLPGGVNDLISFAKGFDRCYLAWESDEAEKTLSPDLLGQGATLVVIGPEGGFEETEAKRLIKVGFSPVTFGDTILRWETAATYCLSLGFYAGQEAS